MLEGWRDTTVDVDLKLEPEPAGALEAIRGLKEELDVNVELAAPDQFIPPLPGWQQRSRYIGTWGNVAFYHYDAHAQALSKIERGHARDLADARELVARGLVTTDELVAAFAAIRPELHRYPAIDERAFQAKVDAFVEALKTS